MPSCPQCGTPLLDPELCDACGWTRAPQAPPPAALPWLHGPPPCTPEENCRALQLVRAILTREITVAQAHDALHALFAGREQAR